MGVRDMPVSGEAAELMNAAGIDTEAIGEAARRIAPVRR